MNTYRNSAGYRDPSAGEAIAAIERERRREKMLKRLQTREDYEGLCRQFRNQAEELGFNVPGQLWLKSTTTGEMFKNG